MTYPAWMKLRPNAPLVRALFTSQSLLLVTSLIALIALTPQPPGIKQFRPGGPGEQSGPATTTAAPTPGEVPGGPVDPGVAPPPGEPPPPGSPVAAPPPPVPKGNGALNGKYKYTATYRYPGEEPESEEMTLLIATFGDSTGETRQIYRYGGSDDMEYQVSWTPSGMKIQSMDLGGFECNWEPDINQIELPLAEGKSWSSDSSCSETFEDEEGEETIVFRHQGSYRVVRRENVPVGGVQVDAFVIERKNVITTTFDGETETEEITETEWFSTDRRLTVKQIDHTQSQDPDGEVFEETREIVLQSLNPE